jgi:predicted aspartyl protease
MRRLTLIGALALAAACAHPPPSLHTAKLMVEDSGAGGVRAYVSATVGGKPTRMLVDTGAFQSVLPATIARERKLRTRTAPDGVFMVDANGNRTTLVYVPDVPVQFEGEAAAGLLDFVMNSSRVWDEAILAPYALVQPGRVLVIDLGRGELRNEAEEAALQRLRAESPPQEVTFRKCGLFNRAHRVVGTTINGVAAEMLIDTGAEHTVLARNNPALPSMMATEGVRGATLGVTSTGQALSVNAVPVEFAATQFVLRVLVSPTSGDCYRGALGTDVLRHCILVWGWDHLWVACRAPGELTRDAAKDASASPAKP